jgi:hypothetical protein
MRATGVIFIRYADRHGIHAEWRKQFPVTAQDWRKLNQLPLTAAILFMQLHATS